jgi:hypothetical protein
MPSTGETRWLGGSAVGEGSTVCVTVGGIVSIGAVAETAGRVFVGSDIEVGSITGAGVGVQAVSRKKATTIRFFIEGNYMVFLLHGVARRNGATTKQSPVTQKGLDCERSLLKRRLLCLFAARNDMH